MDLHAFADEMVKIAASALRSRAWMKPVAGKLTGAYRWDLMLGKKRVGALALKPGKAQVQGIELEPAYQGLGLGKKFYGEAMRRMPGQTLASDLGVSREAAQTWRSMGKRKSYTLREALPTEKGPRFVASLPAKSGKETVKVKPMPRPKANTPEELEVLRPIREEERNKLLYGLFGKPPK